MPSKVALVALTETGKETALRLKSKWARPCHIYSLAKLADNQVTGFDKRPTQAIAELFQQVDVLVCIMATGIVVRAIAPVVQDKAADPAVIVLDEKATNVISLLSGHLGGANEVTKEIASLLEANPVITTATDVQNVVALDTLAKSVNGWRSDLRPLVKEFNGLLANRERVYFYQEKPWIEDVRGLSLLEANQVEEVLAGDAPLILLQTKEMASKREHLAVIYPKPYVLGVGARKNVSSEIFYRNFQEFCQEQGIEQTEIARIVSIDVKKDEEAILDLAERLSCPFDVYSKEELEKVADKYPCSDFVKKTVGVGSVALASADLASDGQVLSERYAKDGCTFALAKFPIK
ncbi:TPA: cobalt-precorrin 5A hydrolase [Streptococcus suis]